MKKIYMLPCFVSLAVAGAFTAGCGSANTPAAPSAPAAVQVQPKPKTFHEITRDEIQKLRKYSVHTFDSDVARLLPPALKFLEENAYQAVSNKSAYADVQSTFLKTAARARDYEIGKAIADSLLKTEGLFKGLNIDAAQYLAEGLAAKGDFAGAEAYYTPYLKMNGSEIPMNCLSRAVGLRAALYTARNDLDGALKAIAEGRALTPGNEGYMKGYLALVDDEAAKVYETFYRYEEAYNYCIKNGRLSRALKIITKGLISDEERGKKIAAEIIADTSLPLLERSDAWKWLFCRDHAIADKYLEEMLGKTPAETNRLVNSLSAMVIYAGSVFDRKDTAYYSNNSETIRVWETYLPIVKRIGKAPDYKMAQYACVAYAGTGNLAGAVAAAKEGLANESLAQEERYCLELATRTLLLTGDIDAIAAKIGKIEKEVAGDLNAAKRIKFLDRVASVAVISRNDNLARAFAKYRSLVQPTLDKKEYRTRFTNRRVAGAGDWDNIPFRPEEQRFERKYGGHGLDFMLTDVATGDRGSATQGKGDSIYPSSLQAVADEWGIHFLITFYDSRAREFESGALDPGSYECYIAPGDNQPYTCFLVRPVKDALGTIFSTSYDSPGHRRVDQSNPLKFRSETIFTDDALKTYVAFSWDNFATLVPNKNSKWELECIFWGPVPSAWNGTASIHGRSTWGTLSFDISDADRVKIFRAQLFKAVNAYKAEKNPGAALANCAQGGVFDFWQDDAVGDPDFYNEVLKPLEAELDEAAARVKVGMPDAEVVSLTENYLQRWRDIRFTVGRLRAEYLKRGLTE